MSFLLYFIKVVACSGILFGYYHLFLRNKRFHHYNRFYLLGSLILSIALPLFKIPVPEEGTSALPKVVYQTARVVTLPPLPQQTAGPAQQASPWFTLSHSIWFLYSAGILVLMVILGRSLWYIRKISRQYPFELVEKLKFYQTHEPGTPFSFFRSIFWNDQLNFNSTQGQQIFRHELFHVQQKHSVDILLAEIITVLGWFNPFFFLMKKELKAIHEFMADQYAASGSNRYHYAELLVKQVLATRQVALTHPFFQNHLKRRIVMITQLNQSKYGYWSRVMVLPVSVLLFLSVTLYAADHKVVAAPQEIQEQPNTDKELPVADTIPVSKQLPEKQVRKAAALKANQDQQLADEQQFRYEKEYKEKELKITRKKQAILEKMVTEQVKTDQEVRIRQELHEQRLQEQALYTIAINQNNNQHFNYDEKKKLEQTVQGHYNYAEDTTQRKLNRFFNRNFRYPQEMIDNGGAGSIWYSFLLDETGRLRDYEIHQEEPAAAKGMVQEIVIVGYPGSSRQSGTPLSTENKQRFMKNEVLRIAEKSEKEGNLFGAGKVSPGRYYYKATFRLGN